MFRSFGMVVWRHPWVTVVVVVFLLLVGAGVSLPCYALQQWHAAQTAVKERRYDDAQRHLDVCLFVWPDSVPVRLLAARAARMSGHLPEAEAHLHRCVKLQKQGNDDVQLEFLLLRIQRGEVDEVAPTLQRLADNHHPEESLILETLAAAYMHDHRYGPAIQVLDRWTHAMPEEALPYFWRGWVLERLDYSEEAMKEYQQALALAPDVPNYRLQVAAMFLLKKNAPEALPHLEMLHRQFPERADVLSGLGQCRFLQGDLEGARPLLEAAVEKLPEDPPLLGTLAKLELQEGRPAKAEEWVRRLLKVDSSDPEALFTLHASLRAQGRTEEATAALAQYEDHKASLDRASRLLKEEAGAPTKQASTAYEVGAIFLKVGPERLGLHWLHEALERDPGHQPSHRLLAEYYEKKGDRKNAASHRQALAQAVKAADTPGAGDKSPPPR
jgi:tetratricopeptide (TPR) repeat protein